MKMLTLPLFAMALGSVAPVPNEPVTTRTVAPFTQAPDCPERRPYLSDGRPLKPQRLGELPPARMDLAVDYYEDGCPVPVTAKERVGG